MKFTDLNEGYRTLPNIDTNRYGDRSGEGLEGPFRAENGKVVYYDAKAGMYYDPDTDFYLSNEEWEEMNESVTEGSLKVKGTDLHDLVVSMVQDIDYNDTKTLADIARTLGKEVFYQNDKVVLQDPDFDQFAESEQDWGSMNKRQFKRAELQGELGHENTPEFIAKMRDAERGPWYIKIDGKIYRQKGEPKVFDWKKGANNYGLAILKNRPELKGKIVITRKIDENEGLGEGGFFDPDKPNIGDMVKHRNGATGKVKKIGTQGNETHVYFRDENGEMNYGQWKKHVFPMEDSNGLGEAITEAQFDEAAGEKDACYHKVKSRYKVWPSAYASGALVQCRKVGAKNWGNKK